MSTKDETSSLERPANGQALVVQRNTSLNNKDADWNAVPAYPRNAGSAQVDPAVYLHAVRRHWLLGSVLGAICAVLFGAALWFLLPKNYTASSLIQVSMRQDAVIFGEKQQLQHQTQISRSTRTPSSSCLKVRWSFAAALRKPEIIALEIVQREIGPD